MSRIGLRVEHLPNPTPVHAVRKGPKRHFPYTWYYRTEVTNLWNAPLKVVQFESYFWQGQRWVAMNILRRPLDTEVFMRWYGKEDGTQRSDGWLRPGEKAVCHINWHGSNAPNAPRCKWVFYATDENGSLFEGEAEIVSLPYPSDAPQRN